MDKSLALRLDASSAHYDESLYRRLGKLSSEYVQNGLQCLNYFLPDFDAALDLSNALATLPTGTTTATFDKLDRTAGRSYSHPAGATQIEVLATAISQILFGGETNRRVEARNDENEGKADAMNQMLAWNDSQQPSYRQGFDWVKDSIIFNRGVMYNFWCDQYETETEPVEYEIPFKAEIDPTTNRRLKKPLNYESEMVTRWRSVRKKVGGYTKIVNISPYDFICDPTVPISRMNEMRYAGHRVVLTWQELKRRSELPTSDYQYVLPEVVKRLKNQKARRGLTAISPGSSMMSTSRSYFERQRRGNPTPDIGLTDKVNKEDGGTVECYIVTIRLKPKTYGIYKDDEDELVEFLFAGETDLLSVNVMTNKHGEFPYAVGEARPNAHMQFGPSWALIMKPTQDIMDDLKWRHTEQVARSGMMFLADGTKCDLEQVLQDTNRIRQVVQVTEEGAGTPFDNIIKQLPVTDTTSRFPEEWGMWEATMEKTSGAQPNVQGQTSDPSQTLGQYQDVAQMAMGRLSTIARNLSSSTLINQTRQISMNFQQWMSDEQTVRITGDPKTYDPDTPPPKYMTIRREPLSDEEKAELSAQYDKASQEAISQGLPPPPPDPRMTQPDIQFGFDVIAHDGALPGTDSRAVAAAARLIESAANPAFQNCFDPTQPGNLDPKALLFFIARKTGMPIKDFIIDRETAQKNLQAKQLALGAPGAQQQPAQAPQGPPAAPDATGAPNAAVVPPTPSAEPPQAQGITLTP